MDRSDVQFITQQMFRRDNGKIALADLYFPQINLTVEIDEGRHKGQKIEDEEQTDEIIKNKLKYFEEVAVDKFEEKRIEVIKNSLEKINLKVDEIVDEIKRRIKSLEESHNFLPWIQIYKKPDYYIELGYLDTKDKPAFRTIQEVSKLFHKDWKKSARQCCFENKTSSRNRVWCPKLKLNGVKYNVKWENKITEDGKIIYESDQKTNLTT